MGEAAAKEPTMEDILSSIRKIIAEEGDQPVEGEDRNMALDAEVEVESDTGASQTKEPGVALEKTTPPVSASPSSQTASSDTSKPFGSLAEIAASLQSEEKLTPPIPAASKPEPAKAVPVETRVETRVQMAEAQPPKLPEPPMAKPPVPATPPSSEVSVEPPVRRPVETPPELPEVEASEPAVSAEASMPAPSSEESEFKGALMSPSSDTSVSGSFDRLKRSVMDDLDAKTEAILRPMLREWLDENLPNLVERLVREEIERVARG